MTGTMIIQGVILGAVVASIVCLIVGFKHKPVKKAVHANQYINKNSVEITERHDRFVNSNVDRTAINRN